MLEVNEIALNPNHVECVGKIVKPDVKGQGYFFSIQMVSGNSHNFTDPSGENIKSYRDIFIEKLNRELK